MKVLVRSVKRILVEDFAVSIEISFGELSKKVFAICKFGRNSNLQQLQISTIFNKYEDHQ
jgi:hypothetical protein